MKDPLDQLIEIDPNSDMNVLVDQLFAKDVVAIVEPPKQKIQH
jgi:hypothetical protein